MSQSSDSLRLSTVPSPRRPQTISRPEWPWSTGAYRDAHRSSSSTSSNPISAANWDTRLSGSSTRGPASSVSSRRVNSTPKLGTGEYMRPGEGETTRQWSLTGFEWTIKDAAKLRDFVEGVSTGEDDVPPTADDFELLKQSPMLGDNRFKLEIALTSPPNGASERPRLSLYITSLFLDYAHGDLETAATMMAAIKTQDDKSGERGARPEWIWEFWQHDWVFRRESEVWECPLPPLSELLDNVRIREADSFIICLQIHSPSGPTIPQQPSVSYVPRDLLDGLEASLDNPNTGDVRFICLERFVEATDSGSAPTSSLSRQTSTALGSAHHPFSTQTTARKRVIYAHSDILIRRSEYFATMLSSSFSENTTSSPGERKVHTIVVEEADFETIYWLLKFCYANWLLFKQHDDPRAAVEGIGAGWSAKWLNSHENEWDWKTFYKVTGDESTLDSRSATSGDGTSVASTSISKKSDELENVTVPITPGSSSAQTSAGKGASAGTSRQDRLTPRRSNASVSTSGVASSTASRLKSAPVTVATSGYASRSYPASLRVPRQIPPVVPDPHPHPTPPPPPASALAMYQIAHRYAMGGLATLALEHIMSTITPQSCFPLLLASYTWDELSSLVEDYVIDKWDEVSNSVEFETCCKEIASGEWGSDGGQTLMSVFRRLRSPNTPSA